MNVFVPLVLGVNLWLLLVLLPVLEQGPGPAPWGLLSVWLLPPAVLFFGLRRRAAPGWLLAGFPLALLLPLTLERPLLGERTLGPLVGGLVVLAFGTYLVAAGRWLASRAAAGADAVRWEPAAAEVSPAWRGVASPDAFGSWAARLRLAVVAAGLPGLVGLAAWYPPWLEASQRGFPEHPAEARICLIMGAFLLWLGFAAAVGPGHAGRAARSPRRGRLALMLLGVLPPLVSLALVGWALGLFAAQQPGRSVGLVLLALPLARLGRGAPTRLPARAPHPTSTLDPSSAAAASPGEAGVRG